MDEQSKIQRLTELYFLRFGEYPPVPQGDDVPLSEMCDKLSNAISKIIPLKDGEL